MDAPLDTRTIDAGGGRIHVVVMHRPDAKNAMDSSMLTTLVDALADADGDDDLRGLLLTGADGAFSAGADVREPMDDGGRRRMELFTTFYEQLSNFRAPTAAAVEGPAIGGGAEAAAACDVRFAGRSAVFRFPGAIYGIPVGAARTVGLVGLGIAKDWVLSSRDIPAVEARAAGFVQRIVDDGQAVETARGWLEEVASRDPDAVQLLKRFLNDFEGVRDRVAYENDALRAQQEAGGLPPSLDHDLPRTVRPRRQ
ncbi:MAG: enoyl-CoA hydratase/isomerase family protein [Nitriliruptorales bacterium]|nr:enoyl-CoA hydratase/isomerase family protein [Nitriliruptorales bacterium]